MDINVVGKSIRIFGTLLVNDVATDPTTLRIDITAPDLTVTSYEWLADPEVVRTGTGTFYFDLTPNAPGTWSYAWYSNSNLTAVDSDTISVAWPVAITTVDDQATPATVPFANVRVWDADGKLLTLVDEETNPRTDATGTLSVALPAGTYRLTAFKLGWIFDGPTLVDLIDPGPFGVQLQGRLMVSNWLQWEDLECTTDKATIDRLFNDDNLGVRDMMLVEDLIQQAEALAESKLLRSWDRPSIFSMARADKALRGQAAWLVIEMATERKQEFIAADGKGRFWAQYERAMTYFDNLSKSKDHSRGEAVVGQGANSGGERRPRLRSNEDPHVFAPDRNGRGPGGF